MQLDERPVSGRSTEWFRRMTWRSRGNPVLVGIAAALMLIGPFMQTARADCVDDCIAAFNAGALACFNAQVAANQACWNVQNAAYTACWNNQNAAYIACYAAYIASWNACIGTYNAA